MYRLTCIALSLMGLNICFEQVELLQLARIVHIAQVGFLKDVLQGWPIGLLLVRSEAFKKDELHRSFIKLLFNRYFGIIDHGVSVLCQERRKVFQHLWFVASPFFG